MGIIYKNGIAYGNQPSIDATLTHQGEAADAKAAGDAVGELRNTLNHKADLIYDTASGDIASFPDGADGLPVKDLTVGIEPVQSGTGDPSPTNVRPISGWTGCSISHSGADTSDPTVIPISWQSSAGTVYGGTLELPSCVLTVTWRSIMANTIDWVQGSASTEYRKVFDAATLGGYGKTFDTGSVKSSKYAAIVGAQYRIRDAASSQLVTITDPRFVNDVAGFKASLSDTQIVYKLESPITYQLTTEEVITTILGQNNIWSDCGPSTVEYPADTKLYIQKINAPTDDDMIADANIASGQYFIVNNNLYISTAAILAGDPIKPGTNCTLTNLAAALNALNS